MTHPRTRSRAFLVALSLAFTVALLAGRATAATAACANATTPAATSARPASAAELRGGVVAALHANHELAVRVLWTNQVPTSAQQSTRGPALAAMRASAAQRQQQHLRIRMLQQTFRIASIRLSASRATAMAVVQWNQDVAPSHLDGVRIGRAIAGHERASVVLHRLDSSRNFVVWKVEVIN